jgi:hypothetical protein
MKLNIEKCMWNRKSLIKQNSIGSWFPHCDCFCENRSDDMNLSACGSVFGMRQYVLGKRLKIQHEARYCHAKIKLQLPVAPPLL